MKRMIIALLIAALLAVSVPAMAAGALVEVIMIYEDYDGNRVEQTEVGEDALKEISQILLRSRNNEATLENCTMNCSLFCKRDDGEIYDFAVATDGCPYITDLQTNKTYRLSDSDLEKLWEYFDLVRDVMGYDAAEFF